MIPKRAQEITPFLVMDVLERAHAMEREGIDVIHLEVGEPDFDTPPAVNEALCKALADGHTHYTHSCGSIALREAICQHYLERYEVDVHPDQIVVTSGTSPAMLLVFAALLEAGDEVILSDPGYACYPNFIRFVDGVPVPVPVYEEDGFQYRPEAIREQAHGPDQGHPDQLALQPHRQPALGGAHAGHRRVLAAHHLRRDLSRPGLRGPESTRSSSSPTAPSS